MSTFGKFTKNLQLEFSKPANLAKDVVVGTVVTALLDMTPYNDLVDNVTGGLAGQARGQLVSGITFATTKGVSTAMENTWKW